jgi:BirA family biotin operon repressor/biotin-[acetyl-CoA-carboxylase] ligase
VTSPFTDLERPPLRQPALRRSLVVAGGLWTDLQVVTHSASTNADVAAAAREAAPEGLVVIAEAQSAGRGRLDRAWTSPPRAGLTFSALLRPGFPRATWGWLPLLAGVAVAEPLAAMSGLDVTLKWPNDIVVGERKLGGVLTEVAGSGVIVGIGVNVSLRADELPTATATSLLIEGSDVADRDPVLRAVLRRLAELYGDLGRASGDAARSGLAAGYRDACSTIGRQVRVDLPGDTAVAGTATGVDDDGRLMVATPTGERLLAAGDVVHVR